MKMFFATVTVILGFSTAHAGFPPTFSCSNLDATITIDMAGVSIVETKYPKDVVKKFRGSEVKVTYKSLQEFPTEKRGCTAREVSFQQITIEKNDGSAMPNASNRLAEDGVLTDYVICSRDRVWMPIQGQTCD
jgi:hypothetical protein